MAHPTLHRERRRPVRRSLISISRMSRSGKRRWSGYRGMRHFWSRSTTQSCQWRHGRSWKTLLGRRIQPARMI